MAYTLVKHHKRLFICLGDELVYTPRDFLRSYIKSREPMQQLLDTLNSGVPFIKAVVQFETDLRPIEVCRRQP